MTRLHGFEGASPKFMTYALMVVFLNGLGLLFASMQTPKSGSGFAIKEKVALLLFQLASLRDFL